MKGSRSVGGVLEAGAPGLLRAVIDTSDDAVVTCDGGGLLTSWSATAERLFGFSAAEVVGGPLGRLVAPHLRGELTAVVVRALAGERIRRFETEVVRVDGMPMPVWLSLCPVEVAGETAAVVILRDVTEQHLTQATLVEVEARLQEGEALAHMGSWLWDLRTGVVQWSTEFHRIHGVDPLDFDGTLESHLAVVHPDDRNRVETGMRASVASGRPFDEEYTIVRPDGARRSVHARAQPSIGSDGRAVGLRGIGQDVTDRAGRYGSLESR